MQDSSNPTLTNLKPLIKILLPLFLGLAFIVAVVVFLTRKTAALTLNVAPSSAIITINKHTYSAGDTIKLRPGTYSLEISAEGFLPQEFSVTLSRNQTDSISTYLKGANSDFAYYETSGNDLYFLRKYSHSHPEDTHLSDFIAAYDKKLSIHDILPLYSISPETGEAYYIFFKTSLPTCKNIYCINIGASSQSSLDAALADLRNRGFNPSDYELITSIDR